MTFATGPPRAPKRLQHVAGRLRLAGYGPCEFEILLRMAGALHPRIALVTFYAGNDLYNAYDSVYGDRTRGWAWLRSAAPARVSSKPFVMQVGRVGARCGLDQGWSLARSRAWAWAHSEDCRLVGVGAASTIVTPAYRLFGLDLGSWEISEGARITRVVLRRMAEAARRERIRLVLLMLPSKERVYAAAASREGPLTGDYARTVEAENSVRAWVRADAEALESARSTGCRGSRRPRSVGSAERQLHRPNGDNYIAPFG